jgi:hypothetical protein
LIWSGGVVESDILEFDVTFEVDVLSLRIVNLNEWLSFNDIEGNLTSG